MQNKTLEVFKNTLSHNVDQCPDEALLELAHAVWYTGCRISERDLENLAAETDPKTLKRVLCLLELISTFPVCPLEAAKDILYATKKMHSIVIDQAESKQLVQCGFSERWDVQDNISRLGHALLPYQTRHYASTQGRLHGFEG